MSKNRVVLNLSEDEARWVRAHIGGILETAVDEAREDERECLESVVSKINRQI